MMALKNNQPEKKYATKGQSMVEVAISLIVILTLLAGAFDLGSAFFHYIALRDAAQEGAIYGSIDPTNTSAIIERIRRSSSSPIDFAAGHDPNFEDPTITIDGTPCTGGAITVTLRYNYQISMPFLGTILGSQVIHLSATVTNTILQPNCE